MVRRAAVTHGRYGLMPTADGWFAFWYEGEGDQRRRKRARIGVKKSAGLAVAEAKFLLWARAREAALGQDAKTTVGAIMKAYIADRRKEGKNADKMEFQWRALKDDFEALQPTDLAAPIMVEGEERTRCHKYALKRQAMGRSRDTINSELSLLRSAMSWAVNRGRIAPVYVWVSSPGKQRETALTETQLVALLGAIVEAPAHIRLLMLIAIATGARKQAILDLEWSRVDLDGRSINFNTGRERSILDTSHEKGRAVVDIGEGLYESLLEAKALAATTFVVEYRGRGLTDPKNGVREVFRTAGLAGRYMGLHALRHTLATAAAERGIDMRKIQLMLGHSDVRTTEGVYVHLRRGFLSEVAEVADAHIPRLNAVKSERKSQP